MLQNRLTIIRLLTECRLLSTQANGARIERKESRTTRRFSSPLGNMTPWKSKEEFISDLVKSIFFHHDGLIALNKPYGVGVYKPNFNAPKPISRLSRSKIQETKFTLEDALPALKEQLNLNYLDIMKCSERFTTGVSVLATSKKSPNRFIGALRKASSDHLSYQNYWAVTRFSPNPPMAIETVGYKLVPVENELEPEVIWNPSRKQSKLKKLKLATVEHRCLCSNNQLGVGLCQVETTTNKSHFVRVYLIHRTCCVLGDTLYSARLRSVLGHTIVLSPQNYDKYVDPLPTLPSQVKEKLGLVCADGDEDMAQIPVMLHLRSLTLARWNKNENLVLTAPLPEHFKWVCGQLDLDAIPTQGDPPLLLSN